MKIIEEHDYNIQIRLLAAKSGIPKSTVQRWCRRYDVLPAQRSRRAHKKARIRIVLRGVAMSRKVMS